MKPLGISFSSYKEIHAIEKLQSSSAGCRDSPIHLLRQRCSKLICTQLTCRTYTT